MEIGELALSVSEVLRYLNRFGIPVEAVNRASGAVDAAAALAVFEAIEALLEQNLSYLTGAAVHFLEKAEGTVCRLTLENLQTGLSEGEREALLSAGVQARTRQEDEVAYLTLTLPKGGGAA